MIIPVSNVFIILYKFFLAISLGALIGLEREKNQKDHHGVDYAGIRTFMLITLFGTVSAYLSSLYYDWFLAIIIVCVVLIVLAGYILGSLFNKVIGMTTEISTILAFIIGILVFTSAQEVPVLLTIVTVMILSLKVPLHNLAYNVKSNEYFDTIKFVLIAFVILPLLKPIPSFGPFNSINLYEVWLMVVFVSSLSYAAYILIKIFGSNSGAFLTGILGGIFSSTATVSSLANNSKQSSDVSPLVLAAGIACSTMFLRVLIVVSLLNISMIEKLAFPMVMMTLVGYIVVSLMHIKHHNSEANIEYSSPLRLWPAIKFGIFYAFVLFLFNILNYYFGSKGLLIAALISGIADVDAITLFIARNPAIAVGVGSSAIIVAALMNTITKLALAKVFGKSEYSKGLLKILIPIVITGIVFLLI
ncbi:MAG: MgtC/SapB family protein [archaeon]